MFAQCVRSKPGQGTSIMRARLHAMEVFITCFAPNPFSHPFAPCLAIHTSHNLYDTLFHASSQGTRRLGHMTDPKPSVAHGHVTHSHTHTRICLCRCACLYLDFYLDLQLYLSAKTTTTMTMSRASILNAGNPERTHYLSTLFYNEGNPEACVSGASAAMAMPEVMGVPDFMLGASPPSESTPHVKIPEQC